MNFNDDDEIWDEFQWEAHLSDLEAQNDKIKGFIESTLNAKNEPRWMRMLDEFSSEIELMNAYIEEELLIEDSFFPDDEEWEEEDDDLEDPMFDLLDSDDDDLFDFDDDQPYLEDDDNDEGSEAWELEGEEWKTLSEEFALSDFGSIEKLAVYVTARDLGAELFRLFDHRKDVLAREKVQQFVSDVVQISTKIAGGYAFGYEADVLGANIAYNKRALSFANKALLELQSLKDLNLFAREDYYRVHAILFELRNDIGIYVQELRERFHQSF